ncbi:unnamed protein product [Gulo gulo]|uniref:Uncharacterized protein n=1 Tax=Gulo gulo TaxID=48420 RepID=A0A9X9LUU2_GULGU|nr:unnamed protein product [Gulo gulo]
MKKEPYWFGTPQIKQKAKICFSLIWSSPTRMKSQEHRNCLVDTYVYSTWRGVWHGVECSQ